MFGIYVRLNSLSGFFSHTHRPHVCSFLFILSQVTFFFCFSHLQTNNTSFIASLLSLIRPNDAEALLWWVQGPECNSVAKNPQSTGPVKR